MQRRKLLAAVALSPLAGCQSFQDAWNATLTASQAQDLQRLQTGLQTLETEFAGIIPTLLTAFGASAEASAKVKSGLSDLVTATNAVAGVQTIVEGTPYVVAASSAVEAILTAAATFPGVPPPIQAELVAAAALLPIVLGLVKLAVVEGTALYAALKAKKLSAPVVPVTTPVVPEAATVTVVAPAPVLTH